MRLPSTARSASPGGDIEDLYPEIDDDDEGSPDPSALIICPFHAYDWNLSDGISSTGMKACTFKVELRDNGEIWLEAPGDPGDDYRVIGLRAVSERECCKLAELVMPV